MRIRLTEERDAQAWDGYVQRAPDTTSDHQWGWRRILKTAFRYAPRYLAAEEGGRFVGILPLFRIPRGLNQHALSSIPFANYGGISADTPEIAAALLSEAKALMAREHAAYLELRHRTPLSDDGLKPHDLYTRFVYPLAGSPEEHLKKLGHNNRNNIRRAQREGMTIEVSRDVDMLYAIHTQTARRLGTPCFPRNYFQMIMDTFNPHSEIYYVQQGGRIIAYDLVLYFKRSLVCQFNGSLEEYFHLKPNNFLFWNGVERGCAAGMTELDYCRSRKDSGTSEFKRRLHFVEEPMGYQYALPSGQPVPQRNPSNPKYQLVIRTWQRLPLPLTQWLGPAVVRYLA